MCKWYYISLHNAFVIYILAWFRMPSALKHNHQWYQYPKYKTNSWAYWFLLLFWHTKGNDLFWNIYVVKLLAYVYIKIFPCFRKWIQSDRWLVIYFQSQEFQWSRQLRGWVLGAFFFGYIPFQLPSRWLTNRFGGKWPMFCGTGVLTLCTFLSPVSARVSRICS